MCAKYKADEPIDASIQETVIGQVSGSGYLDENVSSDYGGHLIAWVPLEVGGTLRTTSVRERPHEERSAWVQQDGGIKIGPGEEWGGRRVAIFILEDTKEE